MADAIVKVPVPLDGRTVDEVDNETVANSAASGGVAKRQRVAVASSALPDGAATESGQADIITAMGATHPRVVTQGPAGASPWPVSVSGVATDATVDTVREAVEAVQERDVTDRAARLLGHVDVDSAPGLTDVELRASPVPVSVAGAATESTLEAVRAAVDGLEAATAALQAAVEAVQQRDVTDRAGRLLGHVDVDSAPGLTDAELRASAVPVSGTVTASGPLTDAELRASPVPVHVATSLVPEEYDYVSLGYTGSDLTTVVYKTGGAAGATVATLTLAYTDGRLDSVERS